MQILGISLALNMLRQVAGTGGGGSTAGSPIGLLFLLTKAS